MKIILIDHFPGCTPLSPCATCKSASYLKQLLGEEKFSEFIARMRADLAEASSTKAELHTPISRLELSKRTINCLFNQHLETIGDVLELGDEALLRLTNFGPSALRELSAALEKVGYEIGEHRERD